MRRPSWLRWPWVSAEWADTLQGRVDRLRDERDEALDQRQAAVFNREQILRQLADASTANRRLHDRNLELGRRIGQFTESDPEYAAGLERQVAEVAEEHDVHRKALADALGEEKRHLGWDALIGEVGGLATSAAGLTERLLASEDRARTAKSRADVEGRPVDGAAAVTPTEVRLRGELTRTRKAYGALEEQCRVLQAANEADARDLRALREGGKS